MIKLTIDEFLKNDKEYYSNKVLCFTTDTVFGIGVMDDENVNQALEKLYLIKQRDLNKPIALLVDSFDSIQDKVIIDDKYLYLTKLWPGALTIIFKKKSKDYFTYVEKDTIGIRIPDSMVALKILNHLGPICTTSVNISGKEPLNTLDDIEKEFGDKIDILITTVNPLSKLSSTVVDISNGVLNILRQGDIIIK